MTQREPIVVERPEAIVLRMSTPGGSVDEMWTVLAAMIDSPDYQPTIEHEQLDESGAFCGDCLSADGEHERWCPAARSERGAAWEGRRHHE